MLKPVLSTLFLFCGIAQATSAVPPSPVSGDNPRLSLSAPLYVVSGGEYRVCAPREGSRTLVLQGMCLWETEIDLARLQHPDAVAGLVMEKASTLSVDEYLQQQLDDRDLRVSEARVVNDTLLIRYQANEAVFLSSQ